MVSARVQTALRVRLYDPTRNRRKAASAVRIATINIDSGTLDGFRYNLRSALNVLLGRHGIPPPPGSG
jgi:hypothetical protein